MADDLYPATASDAISSPENIDQLELKIQNATENNRTLHVEVKDYVNAYLQIHYKPDYTPADIEGYKVEIIERLGQNGIALADEISNEVDAKYTVPQRSPVSRDTPQKNVAVKADPVSMYNGQFIYESSDIRLAGAGMDFVFKRTYKNQVVFNGPMGANWNHSYNIYLRVNQQQIILTTGDFIEKAFLKHTLYPQVGFDYWIPPDGQHCIVQELPATNSYVLIYRNGTRYIFEPDIFLASGLGYRLNRVEDKFGNYLAFAYENVYGLLFKVNINSNFRFVQLQYDDLQRISEIKDHTNRRWQYGYDDFNDLVCYTTPATNLYKSGLATEYQYSSPSISGGMQHNLLRIFDPAGQCYLENEYGYNRELTSFNKVVKQRQGSSGLCRFEYEIVVEDFDFDYTDANRPVYQTNFFECNGHPIHYIYNKFGNLLLREEQVLIKGNIELLQTHYRYNRDGALTAMITPEGVLTQFLFGRDYYLKTQMLDDIDIFTDPNLDIVSRLSFGDLLAKIRRHARMSFELIANNTNVWEDIFPDILGAVDPEDIIIKYSYEQDYGQLLSESDPRFTARADPAHVENATYTATLTKNEYKGPVGKPNLYLAKTIKPVTTQANGTSTAASIEIFINYDTRGRLLTQQDAIGTIYQMIYDTGNSARQGYLTSTTIDPGGLNLTTTKELDDLGRIVKSFSPLAAGAPPGQYVTTNEYDALDQVIKITYSAPFNYTTRYIYDQNNKLIKQTTDAKNENGIDIPGAPSTATFKYDDQFNMVKSTRGGTDLAGHLVTKYTYTSCDKLDVVMLPNGNRKKHIYDERLWETRVQNGYFSPDEAITETEYDNDGLVIKTISPKGNETIFEYDVFGQKILQRDALGNITLQKFDKYGNLICVCVCEKSAGNYTLLIRKEYLYDEQGRKIKELHNLFDQGPVAINPTSFFAPLAPNNQLAISFYYDLKSRLIKTVDAMGYISTSQYDAADRLLILTDSYGNQTKNSYDKNRNLIRRDRIESIKNGAGAEIGKQYFTDVFEYDQLSRKISAINSLGNKTSYQYDSFNNIVSVTDPLGNVQRSDYDIYNRKITHTYSMTASGLGGGAVLPTSRTVLVYDLNANLISFTDPNGNLTQQAFDQLDRKINTTYADGSVSRIFYDKDSNVRSTKDNNSLVRNISVDALGRITKVTVDKTSMVVGLVVGGADFEKYAYDGAGRRIYAENNFATNNFSFNSMDWLLQESTHYNTPVVAFNQPLTIKKDYDNNGFLTATIYASGRTINYSRDELNRIIKITNSSNGANYPGSNIGAAYDIAQSLFSGKLLSAVGYFNGTFVRYNFDKEGKLIELNHVDGANASFLRIQQLYDAAGNMRFKNSISPANKPSEEYQYDSMYEVTRLTTMARGLFNIASFAPYTNAIAGPVPKEQVTTIDPVIGALAQPAAAQLTWQYDLSGNRQRENIQGQPPAVYTVNALNEYTHINASVTFYDLNGNLKQKDTTQYIYDSLNRLVQVTDAALPGVAFYHDANGRRILEIIGNQATHLAYERLNVVEEYRKGVLIAQYVHGDSGDKPVQIAAEGAEHIFHADLVGSICALTDNTGVVSDDYTFSPFGIFGNQNGVSYNPYGFSGKRYDVSLKSYDSRTRQYDPSLGRFLQRDILGIADHINLFIYSGNNPFIFMDPLGTSREAVKVDDSEPPFFHTGIGPGNLARIKLVNTLTDVWHGMVNSMIQSQAQESLNFHLEHWGRPQDYQIYIDILASIDPPKNTAEKIGYYGLPVALLAGHAYVGAKSYGNLRTIETSGGGESPEEEGAVPVPTPVAPKSAPIPIPIPDALEPELPNLNSRLIPGYELVVHYFTIGKSRYIPKATRLAFEQSRANFGLSSAYQRAHVDPFVFSVAGTRGGIRLQLGAINMGEGNEIAGQAANRRAYNAQNPNSPLDVR